MTRRERQRPVALHDPEPRRTRAPRRPSHARVLWTFALGALGIAFAPIFVRLALPAPPLVTGFYRMLLALPVLAVLLIRRGGEGARAPRDLLLPGVAGLFFGADLALWHLALVETSVANATLLVNTTPIPIGIFSAVVLRERPGPRFVAAVVLALSGTALLLGADLREGVGLRGGGLALAAALFYAGYLVLMKSARRGVDALRGTLAATVGGVAVIGALALLRGDAFHGFPARSWACFAGAALVSHVGGVWGIAWGLAWLRATFASLALLIQPLGATLLGVLLLGERLSTLQTLGGGGVLLAIFLASRHARDPAELVPRRAATR